MKKMHICGTIVKFYENEHAFASTMTWVFERKRPVKMQSKKIGCWICLDKGVVEYPLQKDGRMYKYVARCSCPKGMSWPGTIPLLEQCQHAPKPEFIELQNRRVRTGYRS